ncbi:IS1634 family transposase [Mycobacterium ostraviense]|uniref:IS1634 family transposase n=1 Tax=Mycobacterium ostraviense TaxID=2738409 RepID=UPI001E46DE71|nr:IS1634 family transposase [Mycobacterium ostraviense]UGT91441.1 IS1634 family transposase [Mycobacterium ostraviense]
MAKQASMHVARTSSKYVDKAGNVRHYESILVRRTFRQRGKVRHETLANLSKLPAEAITAIEASLKGQTLVAAGSEFTVTRALPHGDVAAVAAMARTLGMPALLGPPCRSRDLALGLIISRVVKPASKLATVSGWADTTLGVDLGIADASTDEIYAAMDWLVNRQGAIETELAAKHLGLQANPSKMALFDLSSTWMTGNHCELAARGYSRDGKKGLPQINFGLLGDREGRPVAVRVFPGNTADPKAFTKIVADLQDTFALDNLVMVGDRGMITTARINALRELNEAGADFGWITALRAPQIAALAADQGPLQMSLFDTQDLVEIVHPDYPGERLIACRNPLLAAQRARKRHNLLAATEKLLGPIKSRVQSGRLAGAADIGKAVGKVIGKYKVAKHFDTTISDDSFTYHRNQAAIDAEAALDGIYVIRTSVDAAELAPAAVVQSYKDLANIERDFRSIKTDDLQVRPVHHRLEDRVKAHLLICMLARYLVWHLRKAWASLTFTDEKPPARENPVAPAQRSTDADTKAAHKHDAQGNPLRSFAGLLKHLKTLTRDKIRYLDTDIEIDKLADPTPEQRRAFDLIGATIPLTIPA